MLSIVHCWFSCQVNDNQAIFCRTTEFRYKVTDSREIDRSFQKRDRIDHYGQSVGPEGLTREEKREDKESNKVTKSKAI